MQQVWLLIKHQIPSGCLSRWPNDWKTSCSLLDTHFHLYSLCLHNMRLKDHSYSNVHIISTTVQYCWNLFTGDYIFWLLNIVKDDIFFKLYVILLIYFHNFPFIILFWNSKSLLFIKSLSNSICYIGIAKCIYLWYWVHNNIQGKLRYMRCCVNISKRLYYKFAYQLY